MFKTCKNCGIRFKTDIEDRTVCYDCTRAGYEPKSQESIVHSITIDDFSKQLKDLMEKIPKILLDVGISSEDSEIIVENVKQQFSDALAYLCDEVEAVKN